MSCFHCMGQSEYYRAQDEYSLTTGDTHATPCPSSLHRCLKWYCRCPWDGNVTKTPTIHIQYMMQTSYNSRSSFGPLWVLSQSPHTSGWLWQRRASNRTYWILLRSEYRDRKKCMLNVVLIVILHNDGKNAIPWMVPFRCPSNVHSRR